MSVLFAMTLGEAFEPAALAEEVLIGLGASAVAIVAIFVAVFLYTVGLHFFRDRAYDRQMR